MELPAGSIELTLEAQRGHLAELVDRQLPIRREHRPLVLRLVVELLHVERNASVECLRADEARVAAVAIRGGGRHLRFFEVLHLR